MIATLVVLLFLSPYILVPFFMAQIFRSNDIHPRWFTYLLTAIFLLIYPDLVFLLSSLFKEPLKDGQTLCMFPPIFINVPLLPIAMLSQFVFNRRLFVKAE